MKASSLDATICLGIARTVTGSQTSIVQYNNDKEFMFFFFNKSRDIPGILFIVIFVIEIWLLMLTYSWRKFYYTIWLSDKNYVLHILLFHENWMIKSGTLGLMVLYQIETRNPLSSSGE